MPEEEDLDALCAPGSVGFGLFGYKRETWGVGGGLEGGGGGKKALRDLCLGESSFNSRESKRVKVVAN